LKKASFLFEFPIIYKYIWENFTKWYQTIAFFQLRVPILQNVRLSE
jgi:hypothetical protein